MSGIYVYAITPASAQQAFDVAGLSPADPRVRTVYANGLGAVVGESPPVDFRALSREEAVRYLLDHQRVVEAVMRTSPVLPVRFGTVLPNDSMVGSLLERGAPVLAPRLAEFAHHIQIELIVSWNLDEVLREIAAEDEVARLRAEAAAEPAEAANGSRLALGMLVKNAIDRRRDDLRGRILAALRPVAADLVDNALMDDRMVANLALLLRERGSELFDKRLAQLDEELGGRLSFRCIGPLPFYSFATVEVTLPSFKVIDQARRTLRLGASARLADIKAVYRRLIQRHHPDREIAISVGHDRVARLTGAYKTLVGYAEALSAMVGDGLPAESGYRFDRNTVESTVLVAVRRQELAASRLAGVR